MWYKALPLLILGLAMALTAAAIEFLPETLYFPVIEYAAPENIRIALLKNGELDQSSCEQAASRMESAIRAHCPACQVVGRCFRGLDAERRKILSQEPLATPSARIAGGKLTMTFSSQDRQLALDVCRQTRTADGCAAGRSAPALLCGPGAALSEGRDPPTLESNWNPLHNEMSFRGCPPRGFSPLP